MFRIWNHSHSTTNMLILGCQELLLMRKLIPEVWMCHQTCLLKHVLDECIESTNKINIDEYN